MSEPRLETPPFEVLGSPPSVDDARAKVLDPVRAGFAILIASPEVNAIARILANVQRKRLGFPSAIHLDSLEPEEAQHYREHAVIAIRLLDTEHVDEAVDAAAQVYAVRTYDNPSLMSDHERVFCAHAARAICNRFTQALRGIR